MNLENLWWQGGWYEEVKKIVDAGYEKAINILSEHVDKLHAVAKILLEKEKIDGEEFDKIFGE